MGRKAEPLPFLSLDPPNLPDLGSPDRALLVPKERRHKASECPEPQKLMENANSVSLPGKVKGVSMEPKLGANNFKIHSERTHPSQGA